MKDENKAIGWMLLRDGHSVPVVGLAPDALKASRHSTIEREGVDLKHVSGLNAIVHCLGFDGDFARYVKSHWPRIQEFMAAHDLRERRNLFEVPRNDLGFGAMKWKRRALADRLTVGTAPVARRAFLGCDYDWAQWAHYFGRDAPGWRPEDERFEIGDLEATRRWVYRHRAVMQSAAHNFIGDQLLDVDRSLDPVLLMYGAIEGGPGTAKPAPIDVVRVVRAMRWVLDQNNAGWVEILKVTDKLFFLKGPAGTYDLLWANLRETPPPTHDPSRGSSMLHAMDTPSSLQSHEDFERWNYYRHGSWQEKEQHESEKLHYASGGDGGQAYPGLDVVLERYLRHKGVYGEKGPYSSSEVPARFNDGFTIVRTLDGRRRLVSELVTIEQMRRMMTETGYPDRRLGDRWEPGNNDDPDHLPTTATWYDAQAYCTWMERQIGCQVRLPVADEYRSWFPGPTTDRPMTDDEMAPSGVESLEEWSGERGSPERVRFKPDLRWTVSPSGIKAIYACDVVEWVQNNNQFGMNPIDVVSCSPDSWGAYKSVKAVFRLVVEMEG